MGPAAAAPSHSHSRHGGCRAQGNTYVRRRPEESVLYGVIQQELETFPARAQARERPVPRFVEREFRGFLQRVFAVDVLECPRCRGRMWPIAAIQPPDARLANQNVPKRRVPSSRSEARKAVSGIGRQSLPVASTRARRGRRRAAPCAPTLGDRTSRLSGAHAERSASNGRSRTDSPSCWPPSAHGARHQGSVTPARMRGRKLRPDCFRPG